MTESSRLPTAAPGLVVSVVDGTGFALNVYDGSVHTFSPAAALLLTCSIDEVGLEQATDEVAALCRITTSEARDAVGICLRSFADLGLTVGESYQPPIRASARVVQPRGKYSTRAFAVLDVGVVFHSVRRRYVSAISEALAGLRDAEDVAHVYSVRRRRRRDFEVRGIGYVQAFKSMSGLVEQIPSILSTHLSDSPGSLALHAGSVSIGNNTLVLPGASGSGKSTLTAELVRRGYPYVSDEGVGVLPRTLQTLPFAKPLALSDASRSAVGLTAGSAGHTHAAELNSAPRPVRSRFGPPSLIFLPSYQRGVGVECSEPLEPQDAFRQVLKNVFNLAVIGQPGMDCLAELAESVPVRSIRFGDVRRAADLIESHLT